MADHLVYEIYSNLVHDSSYGAGFGLLFDHLKPTEQLSVVEAIFRDVQKRHLSDDLFAATESPASSSEVVAGVAALCSTVIGDRSILQNQIMDWLAKSQGGSIHTVGLRRGLIATYTARNGKYKPWQ